MFFEIDGSYYKDINAERRSEGRSEVCKGKNLPGLLDVLETDERCVSVCPGFDKIRQKMYTSVERSTKDQIESIVHMAFRR